MKLRWWIGFTLIVGCGPVQVQNPKAWDSFPVEEQRNELVLSAEQFSNAGSYRVENRKFSYDCSGFIGAVLFQNGIDVFKGAQELQIRGNGVKLLYEYVYKYGRLYSDKPEPGDLIFFSNTYDRNRDRKSNDGFTHIGIIERVDRDGTVTFIHHLRDRAQKDVMNLNHPYMIRDENGKAVNSYLRQRSRGDSRRTPHISAQLFAAFGSLVSLTSPNQSTTQRPETEKLSSQTYDSNQTH